MADSSKKLKETADRVSADLALMEKALTELSRQVAAQLAAGRSLRVLVKKLAASGDPKLAQKADAMLKDVLRLRDKVQKAAAQAGKSGNGSGKAPFKDLLATKG